MVGRGDAALWNREKLAEGCGVGLHLQEPADLEEEGQSGRSRHEGGRAKAVRGPVDRGHPARAGATAAKAGAARSQGHRPKTRGRAEEPGSRGAGEQEPPSPRPTWMLQLGRVRTIPTQSATCSQESHGRKHPDHLSLWCTALAVTPTFL